jgi:enamine deaminase RidA (YjgF/YER057c/UK114 family)
MGDPNGSSKPLAQPTYTPVRPSTGPAFHVSGQVPRDAQGVTVGAGDFGAQCRQVYRNLGGVLEAHGLRFEDIDRLLVFVTDPAFIRKASDIRGEFLRAPWPACTSVAVSGLADPDWMVEIEATASRRQA